MSIIAQKKNKSKSLCNKWLKYNPDASKKEIVAFSTGFKSGWNECRKLLNQPKVLKVDHDKVVSRTMKLENAVEWRKDQNRRDSRYGTLVKRFAPDVHKKVVDQLLAEDELI